MVKADGHTWELCNYYEPWRVALADNPGHIREVKSPQWEAQSPQGVVRPGASRFR